jgi:hypothetical protein
MTVPLLLVRPRDNQKWTFATKGILYPSTFCVEFLDLYPTAESSSEYVLRTWRTDHRICLKDIVVKSAKFYSPSLDSSTPLVNLPYPYLSYTVSSLPAVQMTFLIIFLVR